MARVAVPDCINNMREAVTLLAPQFDGLDREELRVAHLDGDRRLIWLSHHSSGRVCSVEFPLRAILVDVFARGTQGLVIAHNHPSGDPSPSSDDLAATRALVEVGQRIGIRLHDHLIFAGGECRSLRALGLL